MKTRRQSTWQFARWGLSVLALLGVAACDSYHDWVEESVADSEIIQIHRIDGTAPLRQDDDGTAVLGAYIPRRATTHLVTFTTTAGLFEATAAKTQTTRAKPSSDDRCPLNDGCLEATVVLLPDTIAERAIVFALAGADQHSDSLTVAFE